MPLEAPKLDRRTFDDIYREAMLRIPRYTPEWTDFNDSDPGITLLQLYAWLTEMMLYEMNRVPERNYIKFLQLLDMELQPAQPAVAHVTFTLEAGTAAPAIDRYTQVSAQDPETGDLLIFETETGLDLIAASLTDVQVYDGGTYTVVSEINNAGGSPFRPFGWLPQLSNALYLGFTPADPPAATSPFPQQLRFRVFLPVDVLAGVAQSCATAVNPPVAPAELVWEYKMKADAQRWQRLNLFSDETRAFTQEGYILLEGPQQIAPTTEGRVEEPRYWLRCRLVSPGYPAGITPEIDFIRANTAEVKNLTTINQEILGDSEGHPDQIFTLRRTPIVADSLKLVVEVDGQEPQEWQQVDSLFPSCPDDRHFTLNPNKGEIRFGDGRRGQIPVAGATIVAYQYRAGGGEAGNVGAGMIDDPLNIPGNLEITNERPAVGGRDEQDVAELMAEAPFRMRSRNRAITADDFTYLAQQAGGIAKARAIAQAHPDFPDVAVPGAVTVVIVPDNNEREPKPSAAAIRHMCQHLESLRLLTTEVFVKGPTYQAVSVETKVMARPYAAFDTVTQDVIQALDAFLDPLGRDATGQRTSQGWEFDRDFYANSLFGVILGVKDVVTVDTLKVIVNGRPLTNLNERVRVPPDGLVCSGGNHQIVVVPARNL
jgi:predicted phage baseplate assembly protein